MIYDTDRLWDTFDTLPDSLKVAWLLEFECVFDKVRDWDKEQLKTEVTNLNNLKMVDFGAIIDRNKVEVDKL